VENIVQIVGIINEHNDINGHDQPSIERKIYPNREKPWKIPYEQKFLHVRFYLFNTHTYVYN